MGFKRVQRLNKSLRQRFLQEEATILQNQKPLRRPVPSPRLSWAGSVVFLSPRVTDSRPLQVVVPDSLESVVAMKIVPTDVVGRVGGADPQERHGAQLGLEQTDILNPDFQEQHFQEHINIPRVWRFVHGWCWESPATTDRSQINPDYTVWLQH